MSKQEEVNQAVADVDFEGKNYQVHLETSMGTIKLELLPEVAPGHCKNLIGLSRIGFYDGLIFHRIIEGFMIQGGCPNGSGTGGPGYTIDAEFNSTPHVPGVLSMARTSDPNSAGSQFFICLDAHSHLDNNYTAFGKTADEDSLAVVNAIGAVETNASDKPFDDVKINKVTVVEL